MFKVNNKNNSTTSLLLTYNISHLFLVFLLLILNKKMFAGKCFKLLATKILYDFITTILYSK